MICCGMSPLSPRGSSTDSAPKTPRGGETHRRAGDDPAEDLSFGGWRDWLLVVLGVPIFVATLVVMALLGIGSRSSVSLSLGEAVVVALLALAGGLLAHRVMRWWREP
jgi:hypothetical protein